MIDTRDLLGLDVATLIVGLFTMQLLHLTALKGNQCAGLSYEF